MALSERVGRHLRQHIVGYLAMFIALSGTSYAANKITTNQIKKDAITSKLIKDGQVASADVADNGLTGADIDEASLQGVNVLLADGSVTTQKLADLAVTIPKLAFDPATQAELNAYSAQLAAPGTINDPANPVQFSKLRGVPAGFADGTDDTGGAPGINSLAQAEPGTAAEDEIRDGAIDSEDLTDATIANADVSPTAAIADTKLGTISTAGKVADTALSPNVSLLNANQTVTGNRTFNGNVTLNNGALLNAPAPLTTALNANDPDIVTALDIGTNTIKAGFTTITANQLAGLLAPTHSINLPLPGFVGLGVGPFDFTSGADSSPDFVSVGNSVVLEYDLTPGSPDNVATGRPTTTVTIPADYGSFGEFRLQVSKTADTGAGDSLLCFATVNNALTLTGAPSISGPGLQTISMSLGGTPAPGDTAGLACSPNGSADDPIRVHSAEFFYTADDTSG